MSSSIGDSSPQIPIDSVSSPVGAPPSPPPSAPVETTGFLMIRGKAYNVDMMINGQMTRLTNQNLGQLTPEQKEKINSVISNLATVLENAPPFKSMSINVLNSQELKGKQIINTGQEVAFNTSLNTTKLKEAAGKAEQLFNELRQLYTSGSGTAPPTPTAQRQMDVNISIHEQVESNRHAHHLQGPSALMSEVHVSSAAPAAKAARPKPMPQAFGTEAYLHTKLDELNSLGKGNEELATVRIKLRNLILDILPKINSLRIDDERKSFLKDYLESSLKLIDLMTGSSKDALKFIKYKNDISEYIGSILENISPADGSAAAKPPQPPVYDTKTYFNSKLNELNKISEEKKDLVAGKLKLSSIISDMLEKIDALNVSNEEKKELKEVLQENLSLLDNIQISDKGLHAFKGIKDKIEIELELILEDLQK